VKKGSPSAAKIRNARAPGPQGGVIPRKHTTVPIRERRGRRLRRPISAVFDSHPAPTLTPDGDRLDEQENPLFGLAIRCKLKKLSHTGMRGVFKAYQ
jgi:hypothetical protein